MATIIISLFFAIIAATYIFGPFILWRSLFVVLKSIVVSHEISRRERGVLLKFVGKEILYLPPVVILWWMDEFLFWRYKRTKVPPPLFIISQPRSGTTFLLRTLAKDTKNFFTLRHLEWRVPSVTFWVIIDKLGLRSRLEKIDYWPKTDLGRLASKMHAHTMGSIETHGVFFEERMFHHYFTFRRFPFPDVMNRMEKGAALTSGEKKKLVRGLKRSVQKSVYHHRHTGRWLTKENENVEIYRMIYEAFPDAHFLCIVREPQDFLQSFVSASDASIRAKHGLEVDNILGWSEANIDFRRTQAHEQIVFCRELEDRRAISYLTYNEFTSDIKGTLRRVYKEIGANIGPEFEDILDDLQEKQMSRKTGYRNATEKIPGFDDFSNFVEEVASHSDRLHDPE